MSQVSKPPPSIAPARQAAFAWDCSSPSRALRADVRPLRSVFLQLVPRLSVAVHTVLRVPRPRPLAADDDRIAPSGMCDPSRKTHRLTSGRFACYKVVWSSPGALGMVHTVSASLTPQASGSGAGGEKGLWNSYPPYGSVALAALEYRARQGEIILLYEDETILWRFALPRAGWWRRASVTACPPAP